MPVLEGTDMDPTTVEDTLVIATNNGREPIKLTYDSRTYTLNPGVPAPIPYLAMVNAFGNPRLRDLPGEDRQKKLRALECERLSAKWGLAMGEPWYHDPTYDPARPSTTNPYEESKVAVAQYVDAEIAGRKLYKHPRLPDVTCMTYDNKRLITVIDDPEGTLSFGDTAESNMVKNEMEWLRNEVERHRQQQSGLIEAIRKISPDAADEAIAAASAPLSPTALPVFGPDAGHPSEQAKAPTGIVDQAMANLTADEVTAEVADPAASESSAAPDLPDGLTDTIDDDPKPTRGPRKPGRKSVS